MTYLPLLATRARRRSSLRRAPRPCTPRRAERAATSRAADVLEAWVPWSPRWTCLRLLEHRPTLPAARVGAPSARRCACTSGAALAEVLAGGYPPAAPGRRHRPPPGSWPALGALHRAAFTGLARLGPRGYVPGGRRRRRGRPHRGERLRRRTRSARTTARLRRGRARRRRFVVVDPWGPSTSTRRTGRGWSWKGNGAPRKVNSVCGARPRRRRRARRRPQPGLPPSSSAQLVGVIVNEDSADWSRRATSATLLRRGCAPGEPRRPGHDDRPGGCSRRGASTSWSRRARARLERSRLSVRRACSCERA